MNMMTKSSLTVLTLATALALGGAQAQTPDYTPAESSKPEQSSDLYHPEPTVVEPEVKPQTDPFAEHFVVFQVSRGDDVSLNLPLNNANNTMAAYGYDNAYVEVVAYGPGLRMMLADAEQASRVREMASQGIHFSACANTMRAMGVLQEDLTEGVKIVNSGVERINELQRAGFTYVRP
ncbi:DsrE family protein [Thioalkalivibrio sp.]